MTRDVTRHPLAVGQPRLLGVKHACPGPYPIEQHPHDCPTCYGAQMLSNEEMDVWQRKELEKERGR